MLPSNETKDSFVLLITDWSSPNKARFAFKHFITPEGQTCVYMLRDSKLTNASLEHREKNKKNSSLSFGRIWQMSKVKWCHFFKRRGRVGYEQEPQVLVATTALKSFSHPGRQESWVKIWANSLMSNITPELGWVFHLVKTPIHVYLFKKSFSCFSFVFFYIIQESLSELVRPF